MSARIQVSVAKARHDLESDYVYRRHIIDLATGRARSSVFKPGFAAGDRFAAGACASGDCCPPDGSGANLPAFLGRRTPGYADSGSRCGESAISLSNLAVGAGLAAVLTTTALMTLCVTRLEIVTVGAAGFSITLFTINNEPQFQLGSIFHTDMFAPGSDSNTAFAGDCVTVGSVITMNVTNLDGINARGIFVALRGPSAR